MTMPLAQVFDLIANDKADPVFARVRESARRAAEATERAIRAGEWLKGDRDGDR